MENSPPLTKYRKSGGNDLNRGLKLKMTRWPHKTPSKVSLAVFLRPLV